MVVLLLAGCDRLFGFEPVPATDAAGPHIDAAADSYCAAQGKAAAFVGRNGTRLAYDCIPGNARAAAPTATSWKRSS